MTDQTAIETRWTEDTDKQALVWKRLEVPLKSVLGTKHDHSQDLWLVFGEILDFDWDGFAFPKQGKAILDREAEFWALVDVETYGTFEAFIHRMEKAISAYLLAKKSKSAPPLKPVGLSDAETEKMSAVGDGVKTAADIIDEALGRKASTPESETKPMPTVANPAPVAEAAQPALVPLYEAPFSATAKMLPDGRIDSWLITVRALTIEEGTELMAQVMRMAHAKLEKTLAAQPKAPEPSTAARRVNGTTVPDTAPKPPAPPPTAPVAPPAPTQSPVRGYDPDTTDDKPELLHQEISHIEKAMSQDGKTVIKLYPVLTNGGEAQFPFVTLYSDSDKEAVWKFVDVDKMTLATRYPFHATLDYVLSKKLSAKGTPYKNMRDLRPIVNAAAA